MRCKKCNGEISETENYDGYCRHCWHEINFGTKIYVGEKEK